MAVRDRSLSRPNNVETLHVAYYEIHHKSPEMAPLHQRPCPPFQAVHHILPDSQIIPIQHAFSECFPSGRCPDMSDCASGPSGRFCGLYDPRALQ